MGLMDFIKGELIEIIEWTDDSRDTLSFRFPDDDKEIKNGAQLIVRESQRVVFFRDGNALDVFGPGRHTIATANIPLLTQTLQNVFTSGKTVFPAEVFFVSVKEFANRKWGTPQPIIVRNPGMGLGVALLAPLMGAWADRGGRRSRSAIRRTFAGCTSCGQATTPSSWAWAPSSRTIP